MKKKILMLLTLFAGAVCASADNTVSVGTALIPQGKTGTFSIELTNTDQFASSMEVHLTLPEGITFEGVSLSSRLVDNPSVGNAINGQEVTITTLSTSNTAITGSSGPLLNVTVSADESLEVGEKLTASITKMELAKKVGVKHEKWNPEPFDFVIEITDRVILDENSTVAPAAQSENVNVLVKRSLKAGQWSTIVLPFTLTAAKTKQAFGDDVQLAEFDGFETDYGDDEENMTPLGIVINLKSYTPPRAGWAGGKPLLIKVSKDMESFTADNVKIVSTVSDAVKEDELNGLSGRLTGTFVKTTIPEDGLFISDGLFWYSTGKTAVKAFRCWFDLDAVLDKETAFESRIAMRFIGDGGETTGIEATDKPTISPSDNCYDLLGRRINGPTGNGQLKKGIYIVNGKKFIK